MNEIVSSCCALFDSHKIIYAFVDECRDEGWFLVSNSKEAGKILQNNRFTKCKIYNKDLYLYGMTPFLCYRKQNFNIIICEQLACRSTLNGGWVPLDRKINLTALSNRHISENGIFCLSEDDILCFLLAKSVYTEKSFDNTKNRINNCLRVIDEKEIMEKLEGVFFRFSSQILEMCKNKQFDNIINAVWSFSDY